MLFAGSKSKTVRVKTKNQNITIPVEDISKSGQSDIDITLGRDWVLLIKKKAAMKEKQ